MNNVVFVDGKGERHMAVLIEDHADGSSTLSYQAGGQIRTVTAVQEDSDGDFLAVKENS